MLRRLAPVVGEQLAEIRIEFQQRAAGEPLLACARGRHHVVNDKSAALIVGLLTSRISGAHGVIRPRCARARPSESDT